MKRHEPDDTAPRPLGYLAIVVVITVLFLGTVVQVWAVHMNATAPLQTVPDGPIPPRPRLQDAPRQDLQRVLSAATQRLNSYGWVDPAHGIVHIPIGQAMRLMVKESP